MIEVLRALPGDFDRMRTMLTSRVSYLDSEIASLRAEEGNINKHVIDPATIIHLRLRLGTIAAQIARFNADKILVNTLLS